MHTFHFPFRPYSCVAHLALTYYMLRALSMESMETTHVPVTPAFHNIIEQAYTQTPHTKRRMLAHTTVQSRPSKRLCIHDLCTRYKYMVHHIWYYIRLYGWMYLYRYIYNVIRSIRSLLYVHGPPTPTCHINHVKRAANARARKKSVHKIEIVLGQNHTHNTHLRHTEINVRDTINGGRTHRMQIGATRSNY